MALLSLGQLQLDGFEISAGVRFGGSQRLAVHRLLGGGRVIDAMGRDDAVLAWSGILSGAEASDRARILDAMRAAGASVGLSWNVFTYDVVISRLELEYSNPWWIIYRIECTVISDLSHPANVSDPSSADSIIADVTAASNFVNVANVISAISAPGSLVAGSIGVASAVAGLNAVRAALQAGIGVAETRLGGSDVSALVIASGDLAQFSNAQGYVDRSLSNLQGVFG